MATRIGRAFPIDGVRTYRCLEPILIAMDMCLGIVVAQSCIQDQVVVHRVAIHQEATQAQRLEIRDDKSPATSAVVLILAAHAAT